MALTTRGGNILLGRRIVLADRVWMDMRMDIDSSLGPLKTSTYRNMPKTGHLLLDALL